MPRGRDKYQLILKKWFCLDLAAAGWAFDESERNLLPLDGLNNMLCIAAD